MLKLLTILLTLTVLPQTVLSQDLNKTCRPNEMTSSDAIKLMRQQGLSVLSFDGDNAQVAKRYIENATGSEVIELDQMIFGHKGAASNVLAMVAKGGCVFNGGPLPTELYLRVVAEVDGV